LGAYLDQFEARAAEIADETFRIRRTGADAQRRKPRLIVTTENAELDAGFRFHACGEVRAIFGLAHGCCADREHILDLQRLDERGEAPDRTHRLLDAVLGQRTGARATAAETCHDLFIEDRRHRPAIDA